MEERELIVLESWRFTSPLAFGRELIHLLEHSDYRLEARVRESELERIAAELGTARAIGRLTVKVQRGT